MTPPEKLLWTYLSTSPLGYHFEAQQIILGWIVDFWCPQLRLVIEVDGKQHSRTKDRYRDHTMRQHGITVWRLHARTIFEGDGERLIKRHLVKRMRPHKRTASLSFKRLGSRKEWQSYLRRRAG